MANDKDKLKLYLAPLEFDPNNGVGQVIAAQRRYLPDFGIELVDDPVEADVKAAHIWSPIMDNDVLHCHGLYWTGDPGSLDKFTNWEHDANRIILDTAIRAYAVTVPSPWVALPFKRDMRITPIVIGHGLNLSEWQPLPVAERKDYLLWNKNRVDAACNPDAAIELARRGIPVVSTFGDKSIMQVTGTLSHADMKEAVRNAGVYLSTAKETFGIGILEALASGVPVLAYDYGNISEFIGHKETGYLVEPDNIDGLEKGYHWLIEHRAEMQEKILHLASLYDWPNIISQYAALYRGVLAKKQELRPQISVVITNYNYAKYITQAIRSGFSQTSNSTEIVIVDDGSTDNSVEVIKQFIETSTRQYVNVQLIEQINQGVASARNNGIKVATGKYIICLDADDYLAPTYAEQLYDALEADRGLGVAYTGLTIFSDDNLDGNPSPWPPEFDFDAMAKPGVPPPNAIPCAAMFRREAWERAGGYRQEYAPGEDVEFWVRLLSLGYKAKRVTQEPLFHYRMHSGSASRTKQYVAIDHNKPWTTNRALMPMAAPTRIPNLVRSYSEPQISVIIPVGPGHGKYLPQALDSLLAQTYTAWEVVVIDDAPEGIASEFLKPYPFVKLYETHAYYDTTTSKGAGDARNVGIWQAKAPLVFFLDADDTLVPTALEEMMKAYIANDGAKYIYSDWYKAEAKSVEVMPCPDYQAGKWLEKPQHAVSVLMSRTWALDTMFDSSLKSWEDWDFFIHLAVKGYCGYRVPKPLLIYQTETGTRRQIALANAGELTEVIQNKWKGVEIMSCCGGGGNRPAIERMQSAFTDSLPANQDGRITLRYTGTQQGTSRIGNYNVAQDGVNNFVYVLPHEVDFMMSRGVFEIVGQ